MLGTLTDLYENRFRLSSGYRYPGNNSRMIAIPYNGYTVYTAYGHSIQISLNPYLNVKAFVDTMNGRHFGYQHTFKTHAQRIVSIISYRGICTPNNDYIR